MMYWVISIAFIFWLTYVAYILAGSDRMAVEGTVCILMGNQADVAEWFIRSVYKSEGILTGRLGVAVAVEVSEDDTSHIVKILSREKEFQLIDPGDWQGINRDSPVKPLKMDIRGMEKGELIRGPLNNITRYEA